MFYPDSDDGIETSVPFRRRVGHEIEIDDAGEFQEWLWESGYGTPPAHGPSGPLHEKNCRCSDSQMYPIHTVDDCSAPGNEHIIGGPQGVLFGSPAYMTAIGVIAQAAAETGSGGSRRTGGHIHVSKANMTVGEVWLTLRNALVLWDQISLLAQGSWDEVRTNPHMARVYRGHEGYVGHENVLSPRNPLENLEALDTITSIGYGAGATFLVGRTGKDTIEWRVWNTMVSRWRLYMAAGVSAAMTEAGAQRRVAEEGQDLLDHLDGLLTPDLNQLVKRQRAINLGDLSWAA